MEVTQQPFNKYQCWLLYGQTLDTKFDLVSNVSEQSGLNLFNNYKK